MDYFEALDQITAKAVSYCLARLCKAELRRTRKKVCCPLFVATRCLLALLGTHSISHVRSKWPEIRAERCLGTSSMVFRDKSSMVFFFCVPQAAVISCCDGG